MNNAYFIYVIKSHIRTHLLALVYNRVTPRCYCCTFLDHKQWARIIVLRWNNISENALQSLITRSLASQTGMYLKYMF